MSNIEGVREVAAATEGPKTELRRALGLALLTLYGVGVTIGAGIYVLVGKVAGLAGMYAPVSFMVAGVLAGLTAFSYAELSSRMPLSGGEAVFVEAGFGRRWLTLAVGLLIVFAGISSSGAVVHGFIGYVNELVPVPFFIGVAGVVALLALVCIWGVMESVTLAALFTVIEVCGLLLVLAVASPALADLPSSFGDMLPGLSFSSWSLVLSGSVLAFFAFIGFEDIVNMAEEAKDAERTMPRAIFSTLIVSTLLYIALTSVAVLAITPTELASSDAPLAMLYERATGDKATVLSIIAVFAVLNGALIQIIMASRLLYGLSRIGRLPGFLATVGRRTRTPVNAILVVAAIIVLGTWLLPVESLAELASYAVLTVFATVNAALIRIKLRGDFAGDGGRRYPFWVPVAGFLACAGLLSFDIVNALAA